MTVDPFWLGYLFGSVVAAIAVVIINNLRSP